MSRFRVLLLFVDGVGIGPADPDRNPFLGANLPALRELLGGEIPTLDNPAPRSGTGRAVPLDARLGVEGTPQSGTGQTALLTGRNAPSLFGRHFGPWTPVALRPLLAAENLLVRAREAGKSVVFANAYPRHFIQWRGGRRLAAPPLAADAAGLLDRHEEALGRGDAVASDILNTGWQTHLGHTGLPTVTPEEAGRNLGVLANGAHLTFFAHYATDHAGHRGGLAGSVRALERVDRFLSGILEAVSDEVVLVMGSDHGNIEETTRGHTLNPALGLLAGPSAALGRNTLGAITDVAPFVLGLLED